MLYKMEITSAGFPNIVTVFPHHLVQAPTSVSHPIWDPESYILASAVERILRCWRQKPSGEFGVRDFAELGLIGVRKGLGFRV